MAGFLGDTRTWLISSAILLGAIALALLIHFVLFFLVESLFKRKGKNTEFSFTKRVKNPARFILPLLALGLAVPPAPIPENFKNILEHALGLFVIASAGCAIVILAKLAGDIIFARYTMDSPDNLSARRIRTQTQVLQRIVILTVSIITASIMLMTFPAVRHVGMSLLASAGLAGLIVGMAARSTLSSLIAGVQVALTQPIRIEDAIVVEGVNGDGLRKLTLLISWYGFGIFVG